MFIYFRLWTGSNQSIASPLKHEDLQEKKIERQNFRLIEIDDLARLFRHRAGTTVLSRTFNRNVCAGKIKPIFHSASLSLRKVDQSSINLSMNRVLKQMIINLIPMRQSPCFYKNTLYLTHHGSKNPLEPNNDVF